jgi:hypothetical protein
MYCSQCGALLTENAKFCGKCGTEQDVSPQSQAQAPAAGEPEVQQAPADQTPPNAYYAYDNPNVNTHTVTLEPVKLRPKKSFGLTKILVSVLICAVVIGGAAALIINLPRLFMPSNEVAVTLQAITNISNLSSFNYRLTMSVEDEFDMTAKGYLYLGKDLFSSIFEMEADIQERRSSSGGRLVFYDGSLALSSRDSWNDYESFEYISREAWIDEFFRSLRYSGIRIDERDIDFNKLVKDGKFNTAELERLSEELSKNMDDYFDGLDAGMSEYLKNPEKLQAEVEKLFMSFLRECEKDEFLEQFISNNEKTREGGSTTYNYEIRVFRFINTFVQYCIDSLDRSKYPEIYRVLKEVAEDSRMDLDDMLDRVSREVKDALNSIGRDFNDRITVSLTVSRAGILERLSVRFNAGSQRITFRLDITEHNSVQPNMSNVREFAEKAEAGGSGRGVGGGWGEADYYDDYYYPEPDYWEESAGDNNWGWDDPAPAVADWYDYSSAYIPGGIQIASWGSIIPAVHFDPVGWHDITTQVNPWSDNATYDLRPEMESLGGPQTEYAPELWEDGAIAWTEAGEYVQYTINVETAGRYSFAAWLASGAEDPGYVQIWYNNNYVGFAGCDAYGWQSYMYYSIGEIDMQAGGGVIRVEFSGSMNFAALEVFMVDAYEYPAEEADFWGEDWW